MCMEMSRRDGRVAPVTGGAQGTGLAPGAAGAALERLLNGLAPAALTAR